MENIMLNGKYIDLDALSIEELKVMFDNVNMDALKIKNEIDVMLENLT